eukprot:c19450_g1_i1.p1 GENE.c19450_g1_i1~~c19450_g1_i1.p1  ORF type:complete len:476 (+),score=122.94 c19450_g1_i1:32-1429(+)
MLSRPACSVLRTRLPQAKVGVRCLGTDRAFLREKLSGLIPQWNAEVSAFRKEHGAKVLGQHTVDMAYSGMRGIKSMVWETSLLDPEEGIRFRGLSIPQVQEKLPHGVGTEPLPEGLFYLLLTGEVPTPETVSALSEEFASRSELPEFTKKMIAHFPADMHPMTQLSMAIMSLQPYSHFARDYSSGGLRKQDYWVPVLEDSLDIIAKLPTIAAGIYRHTFHKGHMAWVPAERDIDLSANFARQLDEKFGSNATFHDLMRLYLTIHADHEGGNVSAHTVHLVGSALSDPYLCIAAGLNGLAGPLHGLANQECLRFQKFMLTKLGQPPYSAEAVAKATWDILNAGQVVPGFGHAVLRKTDPRYTCQQQFALKHFPDDPLFQLVNKMYEVVPKVLTEHGKTKNPWPNVDAHSGCLLQHFKLKEENFYTVLFGVSRAIGTLAQLVIDRAMMLPIERPKSVTTQWLKQNVK